MADIPKRILQIAQGLQHGQPPRRFKVRAILKWFGASRRGSSILSEVQATLANVGLRTEPALDDAGISDLVRFVQISQLEPIIPQVPDDHTASDQFATSVVPTNGNGKVAGGTQDADDELEETDQDEEQPTTKPDDRPVTSQISDWTISSLRDKLDRGQLTLQPKFQREYVWATKPELPSRLIESILLEIPIPPIYFGKVAEGRLEVIDGQQRLTTLVKFVSNEFALQKLQSMASLNGKLFKNLATQQQEKILDTPIRSIVIDAAGNKDLRYEVFERLNRGSMILNEQEVRNCVFRGPFNDLLAELENEPYWRKAKGGDAPDGRFREREMILRFFAFADRFHQYAGGLKQFLNEYMGKYAPQDESDLKAHAALFRQTIQNVYAVFGERSARLYDVNPRTNRGAWETKFSVAALDIQASALMNRPGPKVQQAAEQIRELFLFTWLTDAEMRDSVSKRTASSATTRIRWTKFRQLVDPIIDGTIIEPRFFDYAFRKALYEKSDICQLCKNQIHLFEDCTVDHIIPYSKGGKTAPENGQLAHRGCNAKKNAQMPIVAGAALA
jgi:5-methylcytosine-specific restriction endonuclease McrA